MTNLISACVIFLFFLFLRKYNELCGVDVVVWVCMWLCGVDVGVDDVLDYQYVDICLKNANA